MSNVSIVLYIFLVSRQVYIQSRSMTFFNYSPSLCCSRHWSPRAAHPMIWKTITQWSVKSPVSCLTRPNTVLMIFTESLFCLIHHTTKPASQVVNCFFLIQLVRIDISNSLPQIAIIFIQLGKLIIFANKTMTNLDHNSLELIWCDTISSMISSNLQNPQMSNIL